MPLAPGAIGGLINLRGQVITALDLRHRLGMPDRAEGQLPDERRRPHRGRRGQPARRPDRRGHRDRRTPLRVAAGHRHRRRRATSSAAPTSSTAPCCSPSTCRAPSSSTLAARPPRADPDPTEGDDQTWHDTAASRAGNPVRAGSPTARSTPRSSSPSARWPSSPAASAPSRDRQACRASTPQRQALYDAGRPCPSASSRDAARRPCGPASRPLNHAVSSDARGHGRRRDGRSRSEDARLDAARRGVHAVRHAAGSDARRSCCAWTAYQDVRDDKLLAAEPGERRSTASSRCATPSPRRSPTQPRRRSPTCSRGERAAAEAVARGGARHVRRRPHHSCVVLVAGLARRPRPRPVRRPADHASVASR